MAEAETAAIKYIFLDIVRFTERSVEAQSDLVEILNTVVKAAIDQFQIPSDQLILIPTGDGICVALIAIRAPYDIHLGVALRILEQISEHNSKTTDPMRQFTVRIGLNENVDNLVTDINGRRNVAGLGINMAQRIMDKGDASQILLSYSVHETLRGREKYMQSFRVFQAADKHGVLFPVYQYLEPQHVALNNDEPHAFQTSTEQVTSLGRRCVELGITSIWTERRHVDRGMWNSVTRDARQEVWIYGVAEYGFAADPVFRQIIADSVGKGCSYKILLLDPDSPFAKFWDDETDFRKSKIREALQKYREMRKVASDSSGTIQLRLYSETPSLSIVRADEKMLVTLYLPSLKGDDCLTLQVENTQGGLFMCYVNSFYRVWNGAKAVSE